MKRWMLLLVAALLVFSLACSVLGGDEGTAEPGTPGETGDETPISQENGESVADDGDADDADDDADDAAADDAGDDDDDDDDDAEMPVIDENALEGLDSYRSTFHMRMEADDGTIEDMFIEQDAIRDPFAQRMVMRSEGEGEDESFSIEIIQIGDTQWMNFGDGDWMQTQMDETESLFDDELFSVDEFTASTEDQDYEYLGKEKVNGVRTRHYRMTLDALEMAILPGTSDIEEVVADIWVADESDLPEFTVRFTMEFKGEIDEGVQGTMTFTQDVYDINEKFTIEPPEGASETGLPDDVPMYPDATEFTSFAGFVNFHVADDVDTVTAFYDAELQSAGWTTDGDEYFPTWEKDGRTVQLMITASDDGGCDVMIMLEESE